MVVGFRSKMFKVMVGCVLVLAVMLAAVAPGFQGRVASAAPGDAVNSGDAALPAEVIALGATAEWWAAAQANIRQDLGQPEGAWEPDGLSTTPDWDTTGEQANDRLGKSVASAGDVNGDGYADVIVGAPGAVA